MKYFIFFKDILGPVGAYLPKVKDEDRIFAVENTIKANVHGRVLYTIARVENFQDIKKNNGLLLTLKNEEAFLLLKKRFSGNLSGELKKGEYDE